MTAPQMPAGVPKNIAQWFERIALDTRSSGTIHISPRDIIYRMRWIRNIRKRTRLFKCEDAWAPALAEWVLARNPQLGKLFFTN